MSNPRGHILVNLDLTKSIPALKQTLNDSNSRELIKQETKRIKCFFNECGRLVRIESRNPIAMEFLIGFGKNTLRIEKNIQQLRSRLTNTVEEKLRNMNIDNHFNLRTSPIFLCFSNGDGLELFSSGISIEKERNGGHAIMETVTESDEQEQEEEYLGEAKMAFGRIAREN